MATRLPTSHNRRMFLTSAAVIAVGLGAYGLGRVYPPRVRARARSLRRSAMFPARSANADVTLGDTAVPQLMQTDAFELLVHDPKFRALAASPGFQAIASQPQVMAALLANPQAFSGPCRPSGGLYRPRQGAPRTRRIAWSQSQEASAALLGLVAGHTAAMEAIGSASRGALRRSCPTPPRSAASRQRKGGQRSAFERSGRRAPGEQRPAPSGSSRATSAAMSAVHRQSSGVQRDISANAGQFKGLSGQQQALSATVNSAAGRGSPIPGRGRFERGTPGARAQRSCLRAARYAAEGADCHRWPLAGLCRASRSSRGTAGDHVRRLGVQPLCA